MTDILATIAAHKRGEVAQRRTQALAPRARALRPGWFQDTLATARADGTLRLIAEVKQRSPSKGILREDLDHVVLARQYRLAGADALSVLADATFFGGSDALVRAIAAESDVPVLYKDVVVEEWQIDDALSCGADALLLMANVLGGQLATFCHAALAAGLDTLVETHSAAEMAAAIAMGATLIGVNARDFVTFGEDAGTAAALLSTLPATVVRVAESGLRTAADVARAQRAGAHAVLIGEALVRAADPVAAVRQLLGRP